MCLKKILHQIIFGKNPIPTLPRNRRTERDLESVFLSDRKSTGKMDYQNITQRNYNSLNGVAYNNPDYGNFLWGQGGKQLGFSYGILRAASHINNAFNDGSDNPGKPYHVLDSPGDQRAIRNGYNYWIRKPRGLHR